MRITVFGATGGTGQELVTQALRLGYEVSAVVRDPRRLPVTHERLTIHEADVFDPGAIEPAVKDTDVVLSALGPRSARESVCSASMSSILTAMQTTGVRRLVAISAAPVPDRDAGDRFFYRTVLKPVVRLMFRDGYADLSLMERAIRESGADWTIMRPPRLTNRKRLTGYRTATNHNVPGGYFISRAHLAEAMLRCAADPTTAGTTVGIAY